MVFDRGEKRQPVQRRTFRAPKVLRDVFILCNRRGSRGNEIINIFMHNSHYFIPIRCTSGENEILKEKKPFWTPEASWAPAEPARLEASILLKKRGVKCFSSAVCERHEASGQRRENERIPSLRGFWQHGWFKNEKERQDGGALTVCSCTFS